MGMRERGMSGCWWWWGCHNCKLMRKNSWGVLKPKIHSTCIPVSCPKHRHQRVLHSVPGFTLHIQFVALTVLLQSPPQASFQHPGWKHSKPRQGKINSPRLCLLNRLIPLIPWSHKFVKDIYPFKTSICDGPYCNTHASITFLFPRFAVNSLCSNSPSDTNSARSLLLHKILNTEHNLL